MKSKRLQAHAGMLLTVVVWGLSYSLMKLALREIVPLEMTFLRYFSASVGFVALLVVTRQNLPSIPRKDWIALLASAATGVVGYGLLVTIGLQNSPSSVAGLINAVGPIFTLVLSCIFLSERLTRDKSLGIIIALLGVILITVRGTGEADLTIATVIGPIIVAIAMFSWSIYTIIAKPLLAKYPAIPFTAYMQILGTMLMVPVALSVDWGNLITASPIVWIAVAFAGIISTLVGQMLWNYSLNVLEASQVSVYLYVLPVTTVIGAIVLLGETITPYFVLGGALIIAGVALANRARSGAKAVSQKVKTAATTTNSASAE